ADRECGRSCSWRTARRRTGFPSKGTPTCPASPLRAAAPDRRTASPAIRVRASLLVRWSRRSSHELFQNVASEGRLRDAGAQEPERTRQYVRIPSTAGAQDAERSSFGIGSSHGAG